MTGDGVPEKLLWVDLEMTGLDPSRQRIIEVAAVVTGFDLEPLARYEAIVHQDEDVLAAAEAWPREHMRELLGEAARATTTEQQAVDELLRLLDTHFRGEQAVLAGNSIHQDRRFIRRWWPAVEARLHYRMLDVSAFKIWVLGISGERMPKSERHRALGDIEESIEELRWCLARLGARG